MKLFTACIIEFNFFFSGFFDPKNSLEMNVLSHRGQMHSPDAGHISKTSRNNRKFVCFGGFDSCKALICRT